MKKLCFLIALTLPFVLIQACNSGGKGSKQEADSLNRANSPMPKDATDFMTEAAIINLNEIKMGSIAQQQASGSRIKSFGSMIRQDHQNANNRLTSLAENKQVTLPDSLDRQHQNDASKLQDKKGQDFDATFIDDMVKGHKDAIKTYEKAQNNVQDPDIKSYIENTLPQLQKHLDSAQSIQSTMKKRDSLNNNNMNQPMPGAPVGH